ncbi:hypothetical protein HTVC142P_gp14 [Pelagibacter phage HTVC142P]|nr:hypothetical protein HTVC142P_gp14 [Pelagibacter phage HTVC142P]
MKHTKAQPHFDKDLKFGQQYENEFQEAVEGKIECKTDRLCQKTGNVYIETESRGKPSGINTTQSRNYAICLWTQDRTDQVWVLIPTAHLKKLMVKYPIKKGGDNWTSKGHIIPKEDLLTFDI